jgi:hypothetical protein
LKQTESITMTDLTIEVPGAEAIHTTLEEMRGATARIDRAAQTTRFAKDQLKSIIERVERLEEEKKTLSDDIRDIYAEAKGNGFDSQSAAHDRADAQAGREQAAGGGDHPRNVYAGAGDDLMLTKIHGKHVFECDRCNETLETDTADFNGALRILRGADWRSHQIGRDWVHTCFGCATDADAPARRKRR